MRNDERMGPSFTPIAWAMSARISVMQQANQLVQVASDLVLWDYVRRHFVVWDYVPDSSDLYLMTWMYVQKDEGRPIHQCLTKDWTLGDNGCGKEERIRKNRWAKEAKHYNSCRRGYVREHVAVESSNRQAARRSVPKASATRRQRRFR